MAATIDIIGGGTVKYSAVFEEESVRKFELMKEDYVRLVFSTKEQFAVSLGDYIVLGNDFNAALRGTFYITKPQKPTFNASTGGYDYDLQFDAPHYRWNNKLFKFEPSTHRNEASWSLTDNLRNHMAVFLRNLEFYGWNYTVDPSSYTIATASRNVFIQYNNKYLLDALTQIAEAFECEWWITDSIIHFGKADSGTAIDFTIGQNVENMGAEKSEEKFITRLYGFGAARNLPPDYRQSDEQLLLNGVVQKRVMLPTATPYVDIVNGLTDDEVVEGIVMFDDVYPHMDCEITDLREDTRQMEVEGGEEEETENVTIYRFKDSSLTFSKEYILPGVQLQVQFQSGRLNGMIFDLAFNPDDVAENTANGQWFEIVRNETYGVYFPNDTLKPQVGDDFILIGWNVKKLESGLSLITAAENEVLTRTRAYAHDLQIDPNTYPCKMMADYMYGLNGRGVQDSNFTKVGSFPLGQKVRLNNDNFFAGGSRLSRVVGFEYKLDKPYDGATIYVGESATYSSKKATEDAITEVSDSIYYNGGNYTVYGNNGGGGGSVYIITTNDDSTPTDGNVYSALKTERSFARKDRDDSISSLWTFNHGHGVKRGIQTKDYNESNANEDNLFGKGFELVEKTDNNGGTKTRLEIDELFVRIKAFFAQLEIREMSYVGGNYAFSSAGSKIYYVEWLDALGNIIPKTAGNVGSVFKFRCYLYSDNGTTATINKWAENDQVLCETFNIDAGVHQNTSNKRYWRRATGIGKSTIAEEVANAAAGETPTQYQYVDLSFADCEAGSAYPEAEDTIVQLGNWTNTSRQGLIYLQVEGNGAPAIMEYSGVGANGQHFVLPSPTLLLSPTKNVIYGEFHSVVDGEHGNTGTGDTIEDQLAALIERLNDIQNQADKKFDIWFGSGTPLPSAANPSAQANYPASEWNTEALKALHAQDIYFNTNREPASQGGRAWRWEAVEANNAVSYRWNEILDADTIASLEKIADVASDGVITGGAEKTRVFIDWMKAVQEYWEYKERTEDYEITTEWTQYHNAFVTLGNMLNGGNTLEKNQDGSWKIPAWLQNLATETTIPSPITYRENWNNYYAALAVLLQTITKVAKELAEAAQETADAAVGRIEAIANDNKIEESELPDVRQEFLVALHEMFDEGGIIDQAQNEYYQYITTEIGTLCGDLEDAIKAIGRFLNGGTAWTYSKTATQETVNDQTVTHYTLNWTNLMANLPAWIAPDYEYTGPITINGSQFVTLWSNWYTLRTAILGTLSEVAHMVADEAHDRINDIVSDGVISGGSEKALLYLQWMKAAYEYVRYVDQAHDYGVSTTAYVTAYTNLVKMLNGGTNPTDNMLKGITSPLWLNTTASNTNNINHDTTLEDFQLTADQYRTTWNNYNSALVALLESIDIKAKELADAAQADATEALNAIDGIAADGTLSVTEIPDLRREFESAYRQRAEMVDLATSDSTHKLIDAILRTYLDNYLAAFKSLANYLNRGTAWTEPSGSTYSVNNGSGVSSSNATYNVVAKVPLAEANFPALLKITEDVSFVDDWSANPLVEDNGAKFRNLWASLTTLQVALSNAMATLAKNNADEAQSTADDAQGKIADIVNDGIISGGSEKTQLYKEWSRTMAEYFDYYARARGYGFHTFSTENVNSTKYKYYQDYLAFDQAFDALVLMLNGGTYGGGQDEVNKDYTNRTVLLENGNQLAWLADLSADTTIGDYTYTSNGSQVRYTADKYRTLWNAYYYASVALLDDFTAYSKELADEALTKLSDIASDGKITPSEKNTLLVNWREVVTEYPLIVAQSNAYTNYLPSGQLKTDLQSASSAYITAFNTLATILNGGTSYAYTFSPANFPTPSWLGTGFNDTETLDSTAKTAFNNAWDGYYNTRTALMDIFVDVAKKPGDDALGELDNLAADNVLTPFEKLTVLRDWDAVNGEYTNILSQASKARITDTAAYTNYVRAYFTLGNYLYDRYTTSPTYTDRHVTYTTMTGSILVADGNTTINGTYFKEIWSDYYAKRADILAALSNSKISVFTSASNVPPMPPFHVGDMWIQTDKDNNFMTCIQEKLTGSNDYTVSDYWADLSDITEKRDPRLLLASLINLVYTYDGGYIRNKSSNQYVNLYIGSQPSTANADGDMCYYTVSNTWVVRRWENSQWNTIDNDIFLQAFKSVYELTGVYIIRVFKIKPSFTPKLYDIICSQITFTDNQAPTGYQTVEGGIYIRMYNGTDWEVLQESNHSVIQNLPGYIRAVAVASANGVVNSSGFLTSSDWAQLFSQATDADGNILAQAHLGTYVTKVSDGNGGYKIQSGVKIDGDQVNVTAGDSISLAISNAVSGVKGFGPNILPNSIINETSNAYGFAMRSLKLESGKTYTLSAKGIVPTSCPSNMVLRVFIFRKKDSGDTNNTSEIGVKWASNSRYFDIVKDEGKAVVGSVSITADRTGTYYISSYLYDKNENGGSDSLGNSGTRTYPVTVLWYKVEEGSVATGWVANDADGKRFENYVVNPLAISATREASCGTFTEVTDNVFGKVIQVSHNIDSHWQLQFTRRDNYANLTNKYATFFVICREANNNPDSYTANSGGTMVAKKLRFGFSGNVSVVDTTTAQFVDLGNGWRKYYATVEMTSALPTTLGICHVMGIWQIYSVGIVLGGVCPLVEEIMANNALLTTGINLTTGVIELRADKVRFTSSDGTITGKITIDPTTGALNATDANLTGKFTSENNTTKNKILIDAQSGYLKMMGPSAVQDENHNLPATPTTTVKDLFKVQFETDPDTLCRVATMYLYGPSSYYARLDGMEGLCLHGYSNTQVYITEYGVSYTDSDGDTYSKSWSQILS